MLDKLTQLEQAVARLIAEMQQLKRENSTLHQRCEEAEHALTLKNNQLTHLQKKLANLLERVESLEQTLE